MSEPPSRYRHCWESPEIGGTQFHPQIIRWQKLMLEVQCFLISRSYVFKANKFESNALLFIHLLFHNLLQNRQCYGFSFFKSQVLQSIERKPRSPFNISGKNIWLFNFDICSCLSMGVKVLNVQLTLVALFVGTSLVSERW